MGTLSREEVNRMDSFNVALGLNGRCSRPVLDYDASVGKTLAW